MKPPEAVNIIIRGYLYTVLETLDHVSKFAVHNIRPTEHMETVGIFPTNFCRKVQLFRVKIELNCALKLFCLPVL